MDFRLKRIRDDIRPSAKDDFNVCLGDKKVGRIYERVSPEQPWVFVIDGWGHDLADSLEDAKDRFRRQWFRLHPDDDAG
jgi:hypothetical protein